MKKILINAITIKEGGGAVVLKKLLDAMCLETKNIFWFVVIDENLLKDIQSNDQVKVLTFPWTKKSSIHLWYWYEFFLPKIVEKLSVDVVFSQTNMLSKRSLRCPELLLVHHAGYFSDEYEKLYFEYYSGWKSKLAWIIRKHAISSSLKKGNLITVQTEALAENINKKLNIDKNKITIISHGPGLVNKTEISRKFPAHKIWKIGYITKFGVQKNFDVLFKAIAFLKNYPIRFKLVLTLDEKLKENESVRLLIKKNNIENEIENHGEINLYHVQELYSTLDVFVFPSICESFGFTLVEALQFQLPIIAANTVSNCEILGVDGEYFEKDDYFTLFKKLHAAMSDEQYYLNLVKNSSNRSRFYSWEKTANLMLSLFLNRRELIDAT